MHPQSAARRTARKSRPTAGSVARALAARRGAAQLAVVRQHAVANRRQAARGGGAGPSAGAIAGSERATELFEAAYDEHARRLAKLYENLGAD